MKRLLLLLPLSGLLNSCTGLSFAMTPQGKITATYEMPVETVKSEK